MRFTWHTTKADRNLRAHGVSFVEARTVFDDPLARIHDDIDHSDWEEREIIVGYSVRVRLLMVSFTERAGMIRLISARMVTRAERVDYEEGSD